MPLDLHKHRNGYYTTDRELLDSKAYRSMTKTGILVLQDFLSFVEWDRKTKKYKGERKMPARMVNGDRLTFSFDEAVRRGFSRSSFNRGLTEVIERGFIRIKKHGSGLHRDNSVYAWDDAWKQWGTADFKPNSRLKGRAGTGSGWYNSIIVPSVTLEGSPKTAPIGATSGT